MKPDGLRFAPAVFTLLTRYDQGMAQFKAGTSGNPNGRPRTAPDVRAALRSMTPTAVTRLGELMHDSDPKVALKACLAVIDRTLPLGAPLPCAMPETEPERTALVESALLASASDGDTRAALEYLRARDPARWPRRSSDDSAVDDGTVDGIDFTPYFLPAVSGA